MMPSDPKLLEHLHGFDVWMPPISMLQNVWLRQVTEQADTLAEKPVSPGSWRGGMALWIVDDAASARKAIQFGAGSVISNDPLRMRGTVAQVVGELSGECSAFLPPSEHYLP